jgi:hypothetical protein
MEPVTEVVASSRPWAGLPPDLVGEISVRLRNAADFVRFHAVCRPWRKSAPSPAAIRPSFLRWPLALCTDLLSHLPLKIGRLSPWTTSPHHGCNGICLPLASYSRDRNWVASADGTAAWVLRVRPEPTLVDLLTGATTVLPRFRENDHGLINWLMEKSRGVVYIDGTIFMYSIGPCNFTAAILRPGDVAWTIAENNFGASCNSSAAYHDGKILVVHKLGILVRAHAGLQRQWPCGRRKLRD